MGESANGIEFEKGVIAGLKQALRFEKAVEHLRALDATPVCVGIGYCEVHKVWHMGVPAEPRK